MAGALKDRYNYEAIRELALDIESVYGGFRVEEFLRSTVDEMWTKRELKERVAWISVNLGKYLPKDFSEAVGIIDKVVMNYGSWLDDFGGFFPIFVEIYGKEERDWDVTMGALARYTQYASAEFAVRWFIINHETRMMEQMYVWSKDENELVRRLASEGCRPALPWGQALNSFKKDPGPVLPILEQLKTDPSVHVRKSVANNLNDISKTHPDLVIKIARDWYGDNEYTNWIVKHGCRTLLKKADREVLALFGYEDSASVEVRDFELAQEAIAIGEDITFSFAVLAKEAVKVRLEYGVDYMKANGKRNRKIFKISEVSLKQNEKKLYTKKQSFADVSVRKHYPGIHSITLIVNGTEKGTLDFELKPYSN